MNLRRKAWQFPLRLAAGSLRPTEQGRPPAEDVWLLTVGAALAVDGPAGAVLADQGGKDRS